MSDTGDLSKTEAGNRIMVPRWLNQMPDEWYEAYFDLSQTCAIITRWGNA